MDTPPTPPDEMAAELERTRSRILELERDLAQRRRSEEKYRTLVESSPYCIKLIDGEGRLLSMNQAGLKMINERSESDIIGRPYLNVVCARDLDRVSALLDKALAGKPSEFEFVTSTGRYFRSNFVPIVESEGKVTRLLSITQDVTDRRRLIDELDHRVKNNLTAVLAISEQTRRTARSLDQFMRTFDDRVRALARSHDALAETHWKGVKFHDLARLAIEAHMPLDSGRVRIIGDDAGLPSRVCGPLTLALHEMTTNAVKHGAFSTPDGRIEVESSINEDESLDLRWEESGGPPPPAWESGTGMSLIRGFIEYELNGSVDLDVRTTGLVGRINIPLARIVHEAERPADEPIA